MGNDLDKTPILNRIKEAYNLAGNSELARFLGVAPNTITNWYNRNSIDFDIVFSKCENTNIDWLITGKGNMIKEPDQYNESGTQSMASAPASEYGLDNIGNEYILLLKQMIEDRDRIIEEKEKTIQTLMEVIKSITSNKGMNDNEKGVMAG